MEPAPSLYVSLDCPDLCQLCLYVEPAGLGAGLADQHIPLPVGDGDHDPDFLDLL